MSLPPRWSAALEALVEHPGPVWLFGPSGAGLSTLGKWLASRRAGEFLDDGERLPPGALEHWLDGQPRGVIASHPEPAQSELSVAASRCLSFRLPSLEEDPASIQPWLLTLAAAEGMAADGLPPALGALPCPGNLRGLRNRLLRWKLLGQLPEAPSEAQTGAGLPLEAEDLASNLHVLERLLLHRALRRSYGNRVEASRRLGVSRRQLYLLIARHGDPVRGEAASHEGPKRLSKRTGQNSSILPPDR